MKESKQPEKRRRYDAEFKSNEVVQKNRTYSFC